MLVYLSLIFFLTIYVHGDYVGLYDDNTVEIVNNLNESHAPVVSTNVGIFAATNDLWGLDRTNQEYGLDGFLATENAVSSTDILVFDTGIDKTHPEFADTVFLPDLDFFSYDPFTPECSSHGTSVASLIVGKTVGIVSGARVGSVRVMGCQGVGSVYPVIRAIEMIIRRKPKRRTIVVMAFTTGEVNIALRIASNRLAALDNVIVLAAAGNGGEDACNVSPANARRVLAVGYTNIRDERNENSNYGQCVDFYMPGTSVKVAKMPPVEMVEKGIEEKNLYRLGTGSSFAVAYAAGVVAVKWNNRRSFRSARMRNFLETTKTFTFPSCESGEVLPTLTLLSPLMEILNYTMEPLGLWSGDSIMRDEFEIECKMVYCVFIFSTRPNYFDSCGEEWFRLGMWADKYKIAYGNKTVVGGDVLNGSLVLSNPFEGNLFYTSSTNLFVIK